MPDDLPIDEIMRAEDGRPRGEVKGRCRVVVGTIDIADVDIGKVKPRYGVRECCNQAAKCQGESAREELHGGSNLVGMKKDIDEASFIPLRGL